MNDAEISVAYWMGGSSPAMTTKAAAISSRAQLKDVF
jgi:hypothetical protein